MTAGNSDLFRPNAVDTRLPERRISNYDPRPCTFCFACQKLRRCAKAVVREKREWYCTGCAPEAEGHRGWDAGLEGT